MAIVGGEPSSSDVVALAVDNDQIRDHLVSIWLEQFQNS